MMRLVLKILVGLILLNIITYVLFSEPASQLVVNEKYLEFTERRVNNTWSADTNEVVMVASCGDEFFRAIDDFNKVIIKSNPKFDEPTDVFFDEQRSSWSLFQVDHNLNLLSAISSHTDTLNSRTCIIYKVCTKRTVPAFWKRIEYQHFYSDSPTDFHIMFHNGQMEGCTTTYFWLFGFWVEWNEEITSL